MDLNKQRPKEAAEHIMLLIGRLTVLKNIAESPALDKLFSLCTAVLEQDSNAATFEYHSLTAIMLDSQARRVTGDIWKDQLFSELIESPNRFSRLAASGKMDPAVKESMEHDLRLLQELFKLNSQQIIAWIEELAKDGGRKTLSRAELMRRNAKETQEKERESKIVGIAQTAWFGFDLPPRQVKPKKQAQYTIPGDEMLTVKKLDTENWIQWGYAEPAQLIEYVADEALALLYRKFLAEEDWSNLAAELEAFFNEYGCGIFLRYRFFAATDDHFYGVDPENIKSVDWDDLYGIDRAKEKLYANALRFLHTGQGENTLLYGAEGMGKSSLILSLVRELDDLRLVSFAQKEAADACELIQRLGEQPFKFIALLDDISMEETDYRKLKRMLATRMGPKNVLVFATSNKRPPDSTLFPLQIPFNKPDQDDFLIMIQDILRREQLTLSPDKLSQEAENWLAEGNGCSIRSANRLTDRLLRENRIILRED